MASCDGVTAVIPIFRADPADVRESVASLRAQTAGDIEILLLFNGADGPTIRLGRELAATDDRVRVIELREANLAAALNRGLQEARNELVARMDADDTCEPDRLEKQAAFMAAHPEIAAVGTAFDGVDEHGGQVGADHPPTEPGEIRWRLCLGNVFCHGSMMLRKTMVLDAGGYDPACQFAQDYDLWLRLAERHPMANLPEVLYHYRAAMGRRHTEQAATAAGVMLRAWARLRAPEPSEHGVISGLVARATWGGREARSAQAELESHLALRGPTREGLLAWQWIAGKAGRLGDPRLMRLRECGRRMRAAGVCRAFLYGAGRHTSWLLDNADELGVVVAGIADDAAAGAERGDFTVIRPEAIPDSSEVLISSDAHEARLWDRTLPMRARGVRVWRIYEADRAPAAASSVA